MTFATLFSLCTAAPSLAAGRLSVRPKGVVHIGQVITVSGVGFTPGDEIYISECYNGKCDIDTATPVRTSPTGAFRPTHFRLVGYLPKPEECGSKYALHCYLGVGNINDGDVATFPLTFKKIA
jgi:hypothetical protein